MARVGGRSTGFAWTVGIVSVLAVVGLAFLAVPLVPAALGWVNDHSRPPASATAEPAEPTTAPTDGATAAPTECSQLYPALLWQTLRTSRNATMNPSQDAPVTSATALVDALRPEPIMTCAWTADEGSITTTVAAVPPDAAALAETALPSAGFECAEPGGRLRCTHTDGDETEVIEIGGDRWISTHSQNWLPRGYVEHVAERVFVDADS